MRFSKIFIQFIPGKAEFTISFWTQTLLTLNSNKMETKAGVTLFLLQRQKSKLFTPVNRESQGCIGVFLFYSDIYARNLTIHFTATLTTFETTFGSWGMLWLQRKLTYTTVNDWIIIQPNRYNYSPSHRILHKKLSRCLQCISKDNLPVEIEN